MLRPCCTTTKNYRRETTQSSQMEWKELKHNPIVSGDVWLPGIFFFLAGKTKVGRSSGLFCQTTGTFLRIQGQGGGQRVYCAVGGLRGVTQRNVPAHGSRTATLFRRQYNPHVCTQGMLGTDFWHLVFVRSTPGGKDLKANVGTGGGIAVW